MPGTGRGSLASSRRRRSVRVAGVVATPRPAGPPGGRWGIVATWHWRRSATIASATCSGWMHHGRWWARSVPWGPSTGRRSWGRYPSRCPTRWRRRSVGWVLVVQAATYLHPRHRRRRMVSTRWVESADSRDNPVRFIKAFWPDVALYREQRIILESLRDNLETVCVAGNMLGKDFVAGLAVVHFFLTRHPVRVVTTSADGYQLE